MWQGYDFQHLNFSAAYLYWHKKSVALFCNRLDEFGAFRGIAERGSDLLYGDIDALLIIDKGIIAPHPLAQLLTSHHTLRMFQKFRPQEQGFSCKASNRFAGA